MTCVTVGVANAAPLTSVETAAAIAAIANLRVRIPPSVVTRQGTVQQPGAVPTIEFFRRWESTISAGSAVLDGPATGATSGRSRPRSRDGACGARRRRER